MPRIRSLKPSFFTDADLAELSPLHRLAFQGLWCHADKSGRLEDKPRELRVQILPYDQCDFEAILADLAKPKGSGPGFIRRYEAGGRRYISVTHFEDHQNPHPKEGKSEIPEPPPWVAPEPERAAKKHGEPDLGSGEQGGFLFLGSGLLSLEGKVDPAAEKPAAAPASDPVSSMGGMPAPEALLKGAKRDRRKDDSKGARIRENPPRFAQLQQRLEGVFAEMVGKPYPFKTPDGPALKRLITRGTDEEIEALWRFGLPRQKWPNPATFAQLDHQWADLLRAASGAATGQRDITRGVARAEDFEGKHGPGGAVEAGGF